MKDQTRLEKLLGRTVIYKQEHIRVKDYFMKPEEGIVIIVTDKSPITIQETEILAFCDRCLPVEEEASLAIVNQSQQTITDLKDILMDNIKKVQENKEYVGQAKVINNSISAMLNMVSLQLKINKQK